MTSVPSPVRPKYVGRAVRRKEDARLLRGEGSYIADLKVRGTLHMAVLRSTHAHADLVTVDATAAREATGVVDVLTGTDIPDVGHIPCIDMYPDTKPATHPVLAQGRVRYVGQPIAAVVADSALHASAAAQLIGVEYADLPPVVDLDQAVSENAELLYPQFASNIVNTIAQDVGDCAAAFADADRVFSETFRIHRYGPMPMETRGVLAQVDSVSGRLILYTSTQFPHLVRQFLGGVLDLPESQIRVVAPDVGGGFGGKCEFYPEEVLAPLFARRLRRPIRWIESRAEHMVASSQAREQRHDVRIAISRDGVISAMTVESWTNNGAALCTLATTPASISSAMGRGPYRIPHYRARAHSVVSNKTPLAVYRGAGHPQAALVLERMFDIMAADLGLEPLELRLKNMLTPEELPADRGTDIILAGHVEYDSGDYPRVLTRAAEMIGDADKKAAQQDARNRGKYLGIGFCCFVEETSIGPYESATVRVDSTGKVTLLTGSSPHGQGHVTTFSQLVADELEVPIEDVTVLYGDTDVVRDGVGTFASRSAAMGGAAARRASEAVRDKALRIASHLLEVDVDDLEWRDGGAQVKGSPTSRVELGALSSAATPWNPPLPDGMDWDLAADYRHQAAGIAFANATHAAKVEVDAETGVVDIVDYVVVHDCGTVINPLLVEGQVIGGVAQGIGGTLFEELAYDEQGRPCSPTFNDYLMPTVSDMPWVRTDHFESPSPLNPYGFKGAGEGGAAGAPGALVNAISDALSPLGVSLKSDGPWTPENLLGQIDEG
ncbi:xanthine dehydrogenase family protein molybdopterin-binding subunit [Aeromicrobium piscarium]|uniref:Xanthine dehydrogenase family protein molybdopterin-binding subunit n=1 Tax=Aeromicrobium piscarium TaxID=2590901 RepID=A0A554SCY6_9ACTN|nr:xanthine dehydrogenase family protein molybdopterin-binding subunit [Aeromicrobium piscarium]TSD64201.1 xanthine dehydrogenase family protein molybdopterin-binding subunit [Aeromicrobium piscarium]